MSDDRSPLTVLLVDDQRVVRAGFRARLEGTGFRVVGEASDRETALALAARLRPRAVLLNLSMRGADGLDAVAAFREMNPACAIVVYSSFNGAEGGERALEVGADALVEMSWGTGRVVAALRDAIAGRAAREGDR